MHAMVGVVEIDASRTEEAVATLTGVVVPRVKQMPGFMSATWTRSADGTRGHSMLLFETEEAAQAAAKAVAEGQPPGGPVTFVSADVCEVLAQA